MVFDWWLVRERKTETEKEVGTDGSQETMTCNVSIVKKKKKVHLQRNCPSLKANRESRGYIGQTQNLSSNKVGQTDVAVDEDDFFLLC